MDINEGASPGTLKSAFEALQKESIANGTEEMTLDEINAEIATVRKDKGGL